MAGFTDGYWWSADSLRLHYRDYPGDPARPPIVCIPGLTRNARDFAHVAERLAGDWRVICVELRGRGESAYDRNPMNYAPLIYLKDVEALLGQLRLDRVVLFGTSLGGIVTMLLANSGRERIAGALLNDIGPVIESAGLAYIRTYVGKQASFLTWLHAARALRDTHGFAFPAYDIEAWLRMAKRVCRLNSQGRITFDYDMKIAEPIRISGGAPTQAMWPAFESLRDVPVTLLRGALSNLLSEETAGEMTRRHPGLDLVTVADTGHAPVLDEPESVAAIDQLLARVAGLERRA